MQISLKTTLHHLMALHMNVHQSFNVIYMSTNDYYAMMLVFKLSATQQEQLSIANSVELRL
jgi:hypothetical protein